MNKKTKKTDMAYEPMYVSRLLGPKYVPDVFDSRAKALVQAIRKDDQQLNSLVDTFQDYKGAAKVALRLLQELDKFHAALLASRLPRSEFVKYERAIRYLLRNVDESIEYCRGLARDLKREAPYLPKMDARKGDEVANLNEWFDWVHKKEAEARRVSDAANVSDVDDGRGLWLYIQVGGGRMDKSETEKHRIPEAIRILDKIAAECRQKFPGVKVNW